MVIIVYLEMLKLELEQASRRLLTQQNERIQMLHRKWIHLIKTKNIWKHVIKLYKMYKKENSVKYNKYFHSYEINCNAA